MRSDATMRAIHAVSSATGMGLFAMGFYLLLDKKILFYGEKKCSMNKICKGCTLLEGRQRGRVAQALAPAPCNQIN